MSPKRHHGATATMPICIDDDDNDEMQILPSDELASSSSSAAAAAAATTTTTTTNRRGSSTSSDRKLKPRELEALSRQLNRSDISQTRKEQERQDALLAKQLANQMLHRQLDRSDVSSQRRKEQERQDALLAKQLANQLNQQTDEDERIAKQLASRLEKDSYSERKRRLEEQESQGLAFALQVQQQFEAEALATWSGKGKEDVLQILDARTELKAFHYVEAKAREMHDAALPQLKERVQSLGFSDDSLDQCLDYIRDDAPVVIHLTEQTLACLVKDTHYRSLFETSTSGGCKDATTRATWEHNLFGGAYDDCPPFQRPKYGCLNLSGDISGVVPARKYGKLFLTLASHMRYRCTFFDADTGNTLSAGGGVNNTLATHNYYAHILMQYPDQDLTATLSVSRIRGAPSRCQQYKEVQIHGPICLATDILSLSVPGRATSSTNELRQLVQTFQEQTRCNILWQEDLLHADDEES